ncbi:hypothetical protein EI94DRAFT_1704066 [Lactarius quietus]|nr:hypothetical protein EI94DRAFT_1704066 [Lactarius quietus]
MTSQTWPKDPTSHGARRKYFSYQVTEASCASKTRAMENADWRKLKPKLYPEPSPGDSLTHAHNNDVNPLTSKKKHRLNASNVGHNYEDMTTGRRQPHMHRQEDGAHDVPPQLSCHPRVHDLDDKSEGTPRSQLNDDKPRDEGEQDLLGLDGEQLQQSFHNEIVGWDDKQPARLSQSLHVAHHNRQDVNEDSDSSTDNAHTQATVNNANNFNHVGSDVDNDDDPGHGPGNTQADVNRRTMAKCATQ